MVFSFISDANNMVSGYKYVLNDGVFNSFVGCIYENEYYPSIEPLFVSILLLHRKLNFYTIFSSPTKLSIKRRKLGQ